MSVPTGVSGNGAANTRAYTRTYAYDRLDNMLDLYHDAGSGHQFHRVFNSGSGSPFELSNLCEDIDYGGTTVNYTFDDNGNMLTEGSSRHMEWDFGDRMRAYYTQAGTSEPSVYAHYLYGADGSRVKKLSRNSGGGSVVSVYIDGVFDHLYTLGGGVRSEEHNELHIMDGRKRVAEVRVGTAFSGDGSDDVRYNLEDHLGNSCLTLDDTGSLTNREEYFPFGETSFGSYAKKRYRFCGKERDEESGLYYYGARYYAAWSCRFVSIDPLAGKMPFFSPYSYAANSPVCLEDVDGLAPGGGGESSDKLEMAFPSESPNNYAKGDPANNIVPSGDCPDCPEGSYTVQDGDTYWDLENRWGMEHGTLAWLNPGLDPTRLVRGQSINASTDVPVNQAFSYKTTVTEIRHKEVEVGNTPKLWLLPVGVMATLAADDASGWGVLDDGGIIPMAVAAGGLYLIESAQTHTETVTEEVSVTKNIPAVFWYATYTKQNLRDGKVYVGRTCGYGDPESIVKARNIGHHMNALGYGDAVLDMALPAVNQTGFAARATDPSYWAIRGREQLEIERYRSMRRSANSINGISPTNWRLNQYLDAAREIFK